MPGRSGVKLCLHYPELTAHQSLNELWVPVADNDALIPPVRHVVLFRESQRPILRSPVLFTRDDVDGLRNITGLGHERVKTLECLQ